MYSFKTFSIPLTLIALLIQAPSVRAEQSDPAAEATRRPGTIVRPLPRPRPTLTLVPVPIPTPTPRPTPTRFPHPFPTIRPNRCLVDPGSYVCVLKEYNLEARDAALGAYFDASAAGQNLRVLLVLYAFGSAFDTPPGHLYATALRTLNQDPHGSLAEIRGALDRMPEPNYPGETAFLSQLVGRLNVSADEKFTHFVSRLERSPQVGGAIALGGHLAALDQIDRLGVRRLPELESAVSKSLDLPAFTGVRAQILNRYARIHPESAHRLALARGVTFPARRPLRIPPHATNETSDR